MATVSTYWGDKQSADITANKTLAEADSGVVQVVKADAITITLPATTVGMTFVVMNGGVAAGGTAGSGADGSVAVTISPNAIDKIMGNGYTSADNKDIVNTKATARVGDYVKLVGDGANGWFIQEIVGTWAKEA